MKPLAIIDTETTGVDPKADVVIEVAVALVDPHQGHLIEAWSALIGGVSENPAAAINGIPGELLTHGRDFAVICNRLAQTGPNVLAWVAHSADFDRQWFPEAVQGSAVWVDSCWDIAWPKASSDRKLSSLALAHGIGVTHAHRALADVLLLARLFERVAEMGVSIPDLIVQAMRPKATFEMADKGFSEERNKLAKEAGFRFDPKTKSWRKKLVPEDASKLPFKVREVAA